MKLRAQSSRPRSIILCPLAVEYEVIAGSTLTHHNDIICTGPGYDAIIFALEDCRDRLEELEGGWDEDLHRIPFVLAGVAGSLCVECSAGSAWVGRSITSEQGKTVSTSWPTTEQRGAVGLTMMDILGSDTILDTVSAKVQARDRFGVHLVDTESHALAEWAKDEGFSFGVVRGVSDSFENALPPCVMNWTHPDGRTDMRRVVRDLALHPWWIPAVRELGRNTRDALDGVVGLLEMLGLGEDG